MIIKGRQRGNPTELANHLMRRDTNDKVIVLESPFHLGTGLAGGELEKGLRFMAAQGAALQKPRNLYHVIVALPYQETLTLKQVTYAGDVVATYLQMETHQRALVEHHKDGRQHFHFVINILNSKTGRPANLFLAWRKEWQAARQLEKDLNLEPMKAMGRSLRRWEIERGERSGIDPRHVRDDATEIYNAASNGEDLLGRLKERGYDLQRGRFGQPVLRDTAGDFHSLVRRVDGLSLKAYALKCPDLPLGTLPEAQPQPQKIRKRRRTKKHFGFAAAARAVCKPRRQPLPRPARSKRVEKATPQRRLLSVFALNASQVTDPSVAARRLNLRKRLRQAAQSLLTPAPKEHAPPHEFLAADPLTVSRDTGLMSLAGLLAFAWKNGRTDILTQYGVTTDDCPL